MRLGGVTQLKPTSVDTNRRHHWLNVTQSNSPRHTRNIFILLPFLATGTAKPEVGSSYGGTLEDRQAYKVGTYKAPGVRAWPETR